MEGAEHMPKLEDLAAHVGYAPHHFHRLFKRTTGVTPVAYARKLRSDRLDAALTDGARVTDAIYNAGYNAPSRAYADHAHRIVMATSAWQNGGDVDAIPWTVAVGRGSGGGRRGQ